MMMYSGDCQEIGFHPASATAAAKSLQSCRTLCDPIDGSPPGSSVHGVFRQEYWSRELLPSPVNAVNLYNLL